MKKFPLIFKLLLLPAAAFFPKIVFAASSSDLGDVTKVFPSTSVTTLGQLVSNIGDLFLGIGGAVAVIAIIYSGVMYITAGADTAKAESARKNLTWAITGLIIIAASALIVSLVTSSVSGVAPNPNVTSYQPVASPSLSPYVQPSPQGSIYIQPSSNLPIYIQPGH